MELRKVSSSSTKDNFEYDKGPPGTEGYLYYKNGERVARTFNPDDTTVTFGKPYDSVAVEAVGFKVLASASYPTPLPPQPPSGDKLRWAPPATGYTDYLLAPTGPVNFPPGNIRVRQNEVRTQPVVLNGSGQHLLWVGGEIRIDSVPTESYNNRLALRANGRFSSIHLEGVKLGGRECCEGWAWWLDLDTPVIQIQNVHIDIGGHREAYHPNTIQSFGGPAEVRLDKVTNIHDFAGIMFMADQASGLKLPPLIQASRINCRARINPATNKPFNASHFWFVDFSQEYRIDQLYVEPGWYNSSYQVGLKDCLGFRNPGVEYPTSDWQEFHADGTPYGPLHAGENGNTSPGEANDPGDYILYPNTNKDGIFDRDRTGPGRVICGPPPGGDFVTTAGISYVSPGYQ